MNTRHSALVGISLRYLFFLVLLAWHSQAAAAPPYTFVKVADNSGAYREFALPVINNNRHVAFQAVLDDFAIRGIFTGADPDVDFVARRDGPYSFVGPVIAINNNGVVVFHALTDAGAAGIYNGPNPAVNTLVDTTGPYDGFGNADINDNGVVAFKGSTDAGPNGIYIGPDPGVDVIADDSGPYAFSVGETTTPSINNAGRVVFWSDLDAGGDGIFDGSNPAIDKIVDSSGPMVRFHVFIGHNNLGDIAFRANFGGGQGIFTGPDVDADRVADSFGAYDFGFGAPAINDAGLIVFTAPLDVGGLGIFSGPDPIADAIIQTGDPLFGSTVTSVSMGFRGLNDHGDIVFRYVLANGEEGVAIAIIPEPGAAAILISAGYTILTTWMVRVPTWSR